MHINKQELNIYNFNTVKEILLFAPKNIKSAKNPAGAFKGDQ